jgi:hypothetical protein
MRNQNLTYAIGLAVPISGEALVTMVTPVDPSDDDWSRATRSFGKSYPKDWEGYGCAVDH